MRHWNWNEAIAVAEYGARLYPKEARFPTAAGIGMFGKADYAGAVGVFSALLEADRKNAAAAQLLGRSCGALGSADSAHCDAVLRYAEQHPDDVVMTTYAATALLHASGDGANLDKAEALLRRAIGSDPNYAEAYLRLGTVEQIRLQWAESAATLEHAVALDPASADAHYRLSRAYAHLGRRADADVQIALNQSMAAKAKAAQDARMQEVVQFVLIPR